MATTGKFVGAAIGGGAGGLLGTGVGIATGGTAIPATVPFAAAGASAGYAVGDLLEDAGNEVLKNHKAIAKAGERAIQQTQKAAGRSAKNLSKLGKKWLRLW